MRPRRRSRVWAVCGVCVVAVLAATLTAQSITISTSDGILRVKASDVGIIEGDVLRHLRDGRSVRLDVVLTVLDGPRGGVIAEATQTFNLSFDLWEERFAVTRLGTPPRSVSHLRARDAEAWCLDNVSVPLSELGRLGRDTPFWIRLEYESPGAPAAPELDPDDTFTLRRLIDVLSRRSRDAAAGKSIAAGPFRLSN